MNNYESAERLVESLTRYGIWPKAFIESRQIAMSLEFSKMSPEQRLAQVRYLNTRKLSSDYRKAINNAVLEFVKESRERLHGNVFSSVEDLRKYSNLMVKIYQLSKVGAQEWPHWWDHPANEVWSIRQQMAVVT